MAADKQHEAYYAQNGNSNEWGKLYTVYVWDSSLTIYRELTNNVSEHEAKRTVRESNRQKK